jgi:hypothetical protein
MRLPFRQFWQLRDIERRLRRSEPHMAAMLAIFARLNAGEAIISREQERLADSRVRRLLAWLADVIAGLADVPRWLFRRVAGACETMRRWFGGLARTPLGAPSAADDSGERWGPPRL